jgi:MAF protein
LLGRLQIDFVQANPDCDETAHAGETPQQLCRRLAIAKARALAGKYPQHLIIGSDQVADFNGEIIGKPHNHDNAMQQLRRFSGQHVEFYTGLCVVNSQTGQQQVVVERFSVHFRSLDERLIDWYLRSEQPYNCAGSFKSEGLGICLFEKLEGDDPTSLIGLPLIKLVSMLKVEGYFRG